MILVSDCAKDDDSEVIWMETKWYESMPELRLRKHPKQMTRKAWALPSLETELLKDLPSYFVPGRIGVVLVICDV